MQKPALAGGFRIGLYNGALFHGADNGKNKLILPCKIGFKNGTKSLFLEKFPFLDKQRLIQALQGTQPAEKLIVDQQTAADIMGQILVKHRECAPDYDRIAHYFDGGDIWDIAHRLWAFCKKNFHYVIEGEDAQYTSCPYTILTGGNVDCKNYALFIGGVLDALKRQGLPVRFQYRFVSYSLLDPDPGHVFIVVNPSTDNIWIDPVLDTFNTHLFYWYVRNRTAKSSRVGAVIGRIGCDCGRARIGSTSAENSLLSQLLEYQQGLVAAVQTSLAGGQLSQITAGVLKGISAAVANAVLPGVGPAALAALNAGELKLANAFPAGSAAARLITDFASFNVIGLWNDLWGRTYNTDQYWGAVYYKFYVLGQNVTDQNQVSDSDVIPALKWFIDRTGVFISGREHIIALTKSPTAYMNYHSVNGDTTTDQMLVQAAYLVASRYWQQPGNFDASLKGSWKDTVGVFDSGLLQTASQYGLTAEQYAKQTGIAEQAAQQEITQATGAGDLIPGIPDAVIYAGVGLLLAVGLFEK